MLHRGLRLGITGGYNSWKVSGVVQRWQSSVSSVRLANGHAVQYFQSQPAQPSAAPTLVLFHGLASSHHCFKHMWPHLEGKYPIMAFDLPGTAGSDVAAAGPTYTADSVHQALVEAITSVIPTNHPVVFVGHSLGGHSALRLASDFLKARRPVHGLVLLASAGLEPYVVMRGLDLLPVSLVAKYPRAVMRFFHLMGFADTHPAEEYSYGALRAITTRYAQLRVAASAISKANVPTLCVSAQDDPFLTDAVWTDMCVTLRANVVRYPNGAHNIPKSKAPQVARDIDTWICDNAFAARPADRSAADVDCDRHERIQSMRHDDVAISLKT
ncbi:hypothetical protein DYB28_011927 [Aphanomyces astaci]|uniref:AB hydrolase-1 domain-containing protein n=1 Tax=Aphanomyces astaci TaxID=112090 RepID=A0A9X8E0E9_APHAT|nr:hypothetical protein DYB28_011927 [Aphanomyces astaci]